MDKNTFDASSLGTYISCPRKYYWRYVQHLLPKNFKKAPLDFGTAIHEALRVLVVTEDLDEAIIAFHDLWDERFSDDKRTHEKGEKLLRGYVDHYGLKDYFDWISDPECVFKIGFGSANLVGRFDGVIEFQGVPMIIDHKTATRMGKTYFHQFRPNIQMSFYVWAARVLYPDLDIRSALLNILYFTKTKMDFFRDIIPREQWEIDEFLDIITRNIAEIRTKDREDHRDWEPRWGHCNKWGSCMFRDLCLEEDPSILIDSLYKREEWDPEEEFDLDKKKQKLQEYEEEPRLYAT